jgi:hypothetical protein
MTYYTLRGIVLCVSDWFPPLLLSWKPQKRSLKYWVTRKKIEMMIRPVWIFEVKVVSLRRIF